MAGEDSLGAQGSARVIASVTSALRDIIVRGIGTEFALTASDVSFSTRNPTGSAQGASLSLLVYQIRSVNPYGSVAPRAQAIQAREQSMDGAWPANSDSRSAPASGTAEEGRQSLQLELGYMVIPHAANEQLEQRLGATLAKLFHAFATIHVAALPNSEARDTLTASGNARLRLLAQYPDMDIIRRLWPVDQSRETVKSALYYRVLPVSVPAQGDESLHRVREIVAEQGAKTA